MRMRLRPSATTYAEEIKTPFYGEAPRRSDACAFAIDLRGILNGIDYDEYQSGDG